MVSAVQPVLRPTVRVLVVDDRDRVLLFASVDDDGNRFWFAPGGGAEPGEEPEQTAHRELYEETGLTEVELGPELWRRRWVGPWSGVSYVVRERYFLARVPEFTADTGGFTELERNAILEPRWWTLAELAATTERLVPANLAALVDEVLNCGAPSSPWVLEG